jgi:hypothetical protein
MVKDGEEPYKNVKGLYNDPEKQAELYGFWQTDVFVNKITTDGQLPKVRQ